MYLHIHHMSEIHRHHKQIFQDLNNIKHCLKKSLYYFINHTAAEILEVCIQP